MIVRPTTGEKVGNRNSHKIASVAMLPSLEEADLQFHDFCGQRNHSVMGKSTSPGAQRLTSALY